MSLPIPCSSSSSVLSVPPCIDITERTTHMYDLRIAEISIPMRDKHILKANAYFPVVVSNDQDQDRSAPKTFPILITLGPYNKDLHFTKFNPLVAKEYIHLQDKGPLMSWETPNPEFWVRHGYIVLRVDERGINASSGILDVLSVQTKYDLFDTIEWAGSQSWSNGKVALTGVSYFGMNQWSVAAMKPKYLAAMIPWEGGVDYYADFFRVGGLYANLFTNFWYQNSVLKHQYNNKDDPNHKLSEEELRKNRHDLHQDVLTHPIRDSYWTERSSQLDPLNIDIPMLSCSNWYSAGLHSRGNFLGYELSPSKNKFIEIHMGNHVHGYYSIAGRALQLSFLDQYCKNLNTTIKRNPPVKIAVPTTEINKDGMHVEYKWRYEQAYPLPSTKYVPFYLDCSVHSSTATPNVSVLSTVSASKSSSIELQGDHKKESVGWITPFPKPLSFIYNQHDPCRHVFVTSAFEHDTLICGPIQLKLFISSTTDDADIFVTLRELDENNKEIVFEGALSATPISQGWLRASLRCVDVKLQPLLPYRLVQSFDKIEKLTPNKITPVDIEIWDSAVTLKSGHHLVCEVGTRDQAGSFLMRKAGEDRNWDANLTIHTGPEYRATLLLPVIPC